MSAPAVAVSADGKKFAAAWKDVRTGTNSVYWSISDSPTFTKDSPVHSKFGVEQNHPSIAFDSSETIWVAWEESQLKSQKIWIRSSVDADKGRALSDENDGWASFPTVASNGGIVGVVYETEKDAERGVTFCLIESVQK